MTNTQTKVNEVKAVEELAEVIEVSSWFNKQIPENDDYIFYLTTEGDTLYMTEVFGGQVIGGTFHYNKRKQSFTGVETGELYTAEEVYNVFMAGAIDFLGEDTGIVFDIQTMADELREQDVCQFLDFDGLGQTFFDVWAHENGIRITNGYDLPGDEITYTYLKSTRQWLDANKQVLSRKEVIRDAQAKLYKIIGRHTVAIQLDERAEQAAK